MENVADALLMGFAILIFVIALSVSFSTLEHAKSTADVVLFYSDRDNFQTPLKIEDDSVNEGGRTVGIDTVISTIYRCSKENFVVSIDDGQDDDDKYVFEYIGNNSAEIKGLIEFFITNHTGVKYKEEYAEITTSGTTYGGTLEENVNKRMYIYYKKLQ